MIDSFSSALLRAFAIWILRFFGGDGALVLGIFFYGYVYVGSSMRFKNRGLCDRKWG